MMGEGPVVRQHADGKACLNGKHCWGWRMNNRFWFASGVAAVAIFSTQSYVEADGGAQPHTIAVTGSGSVEYQPDIATLEFGVRAESSAPDTAARTVANGAQTLLKTLRDLGIDDRNIKTTQYQIQYQSPNQYGIQKPAGYVANENTQVANVPVGSVGNVIAAAVLAGADEVSGPYYDSSRRAELQDQALAKALDGAKNEAAKIASRSGVRLTGLYSMTVVNPWTVADFVPSSPPGSLILGTVGGHGAPPISGGMSKITMVVQAVFEIR
jgi:uncharacterized protein YggE